MYSLGSLDLSQALLEFAEMIYFSVLYAGMAEQCYRSALLLSGMCSVITFLSTHTFQSGQKMPHHMAFSCGLHMQW